MGEKPETRTDLQMKKELSIVFTGDINFDRHMASKWKDEELLSEDIKEFLLSADHVAADIEGSFSLHENKPADEVTQFTLSQMDYGAAEYLWKIGADIWNINNNHITDFGENGIRGTIDAAKHVGAITVGAGMNDKEASEPVFLDDAGGIGLFSVGYRPGCKPAGPEKAGCLLWNDTDTIRRNIEKIKRSCRWCVIIVHGGEEFTTLPSPYTRDRYISYLEMGADIVVGHHPHVVNNYELFPGKAVFYSIGNFIFDTNYMRSQEGTDKGILLKISFTESDYSFTYLATKLLYETERIVSDHAPEIFRDIQQEEYDKLMPFAAGKFIEATKRQQIYLDPGKYGHYTEEEWRDHFMDPDRLYRMPGETLDFTVIYPLACESVKDGSKSC